MNQDFQPKERVDLGRFFELTQPAKPTWRTYAGRAARVLALVYATLNFSSCCEVYITRDTYPNSPQDAREEIRGRGALVKLAYDATPIGTFFGNMAYDTFGDILLYEPTEPPEDPLHQIR
jgi:hypothetical protein